MKFIFRKEIDNFEIEIDQYTQIETTLAPKLEATQRQLVEGRSSLSAHKTRGKLLEGLMMAKEAGHIKGIIGRLGDLGK
ncbi:Structural maintenance of chromosomes protein 4-like [Oopsacas minuta]|uniref:Structural maintenance of chromosomes protein 4-like n=1 Tax=Oopsacas minuta TaxID=111878 RepID=A0AAV7K664_9METZ|nr:Structural maintenance of chromosomes protein 4-like [Oopsacas minuta]